jgi:serine/threonine-protein kinase PpkA
LEIEAKTIAALEHPHILPIYDFGEYESQIYIVMRYVTGGTLDGVLADGAVPLGEALRYARAIATALDHAHTQ